VRQVFAAAAGLVAWAAALASPSAAPSPAYLLVDLHSQRVISVSRPDVLDTRLAPGSIIKIATLIAAMEQGSADPSTAIMCRRTVTVDGRTLTCVHPDVHRPIGAAEALAYSCNTYFVALASRLQRGKLSATLVAMGLSPVADGAPTASASVGLAGIRETPRALLDAFVRITGAANGVRMSDRTRAVLMEGLTLAAARGTAAALGAAGVTALAKTGTAPMSGGGYHGLLVAVLPARDPRYGIVVVVPGGSGADAAGVAVDVLRRAGIAGDSAGGTAATGPAGQAAARNAAGSPEAAGSRTVRVGIARREGGYDVATLPLEAYVSRVIAGEMAAGASAAALEALAVTVRTYAVVNAGRHAAEGFDLCDLTHCQVLGRASAASARAAAATEGLVLWDGPRIASVYFSSSCGGHTETPAHVWPGAANPSYLPARPDPACENQPAWTSEIRQPDLLKTLRLAGLRGTMVRAFQVLSRFPSGRVETLRVDGLAPGQIDATTFMRAAGQTLGWQIVKSTSFDVRPSAAGYVLTGHGLGHGVGLCVRGATNRSAHGASRVQILAAYFPGLVSRRLNQPVRPEAAPAIRITLPEADRQALPDVREIAARALRAVTGSLKTGAPAPVDLRFHPTVEAFTRATGLPWWAAARTRGTVIDLQPVAVLRRKGVLDATLRHEFVHVLTDAVLAGRPLWIREGLAVVAAGEFRAGSGPTRTGCPTDAELRAMASPDAWRRAYVAAARCVVAAIGDVARWRRLPTMALATRQPAR